MALQLSGEITATDIQNELQLAGEIEITSTPYRDLAEVASGELVSSDFYGKSDGTGEPAVTLLSTLLVEATTTSGNTATAKVIFKNNINYYSESNLGADIFKGFWTETPFGSDASLYEVSALFVSGDALPTASPKAVGAWISLDQVTDIVWWQERVSSVGSTTCIIDVTVREKLDFANTKTMAVTLDATVEA